MSDTASGRATRPSKILRRPPSVPRHIVRVALVTLATGAITLSLVAESFAQRMGGFGGVGAGRPIGGINSTGIGNRFPGGGVSRIPGGMGGPGRPGGPGILIVPGGPNPGLGGGPVMIVEDDDQPRRTSKSKKTAQKQKKQQNQQQTAQRDGFNPPPAGESRFVQNEVLLNIAGGISTPTLDAIARRHRLTRLELREFTLPARRLARLRINDGRPVATVIRSLQQEASILGAQANFFYTLEQGAAPDPTQYALGKLRLTEAHALAKGASIRVAVIDTTIDAKHPDLAGAIAETFDATGAPDKPHAHGTGIAGVIAAHGRLTGVAPAVKILAVNAFSSKASNGTSMNILTGLEWAGTSNADVVNMSFAGPNDPELQLKIVALRRKGAVLVAAAGNGGPKARPLYPAGYPEVIAVTATDADDKVFELANRGTHIAVAAPGVAILAVAPDESYRMQSGTSFAAAQVSGVVALLLERNRKLDAAAIRRILMATARDLGNPGHDDQFGSGLVDALSAVEQAAPRASDVSGAALSRSN